MKYTPEVVAGMLMSPTSMDFIEQSLSSEWESGIEDKTLMECLDRIVDEHALFISSETGWDRNRKLLAVQGLVETYLKRK